MSHGGRRPCKEDDRYPHWHVEGRRYINLYDAVAGRAMLNERLRKHGGSASSRASGSGYSTRDPRLAPEEVLFRRKNAPARYAERDMYFASDRLPDGGSRLLPGSDLLKAVHEYASCFYDAMAWRRADAGPVRSPAPDERSMDETALLAFGILLQEASREVLGKTGDLVFTQGRCEDEDEDEDEFATGRARVRLGNMSPVYTDTGTFQHEAVPDGRREHKRRRIN